MAGRTILPGVRAVSQSLDRRQTGTGSEPDRVDCVLIYPPWTIISGRSFLTNCLPPLGLLSIASHLESHGFSVRVLDIHAERIGPEEVTRRLERWRPRYAGITVLSSMVVAAGALMKLVKTVVPDCVTVMGGVHAEAYPETMLRNSAVDLVVRGDGEEPVLQLVEGRAWSDIPGVCYRDAVHGPVVFTPMQALTMDLDQYPMPAYHLIAMDRYFPSATSYRNLPAINVILTRGCPGKCTFCNSARTVLRSRSPQQVFEQIRHLREQYGIRQIQFFDDTFTANRQGALELCRLLREHQVDITFTCYVRGDCFSAEMATALKSAGCHQVMVGIETGSDRISHIIGKPIDKEKYRKLVRIAREHGIEVRAGFIIGNLGDTWETMMESLEFAIELDVDFFQLSIATPYPGTELFKQALQEGRLRHQEYKYYGQSEPLMRLDDLTPEDIRRFERHALRTFYMRPRQLWKQLRRLRHPRQIRELVSAFNLLIANRLMNPNPDWTAWDQAREQDMYDLDLTTLTSAVRLTYQVRQQWADAFSQVS